MGHGNLKRISGDDMSEQELREKIAAEIIAYCLNDNMVDVGTPNQRCFCDSDGGCRHEGYMVAASIVKRGK
jgi:hypothetical protein